MPAPTPTHTLSIIFTNHQTRQTHVVNAEGDGQLDQWLLTFRQALIENGLVVDSLTSIITPPHE